MIEHSLKVSSLSIFLFSICSDGGAGIFTTTSQTGSYTLYGVSGLAYAITDTTTATYTSIVTNGTFSANSVSVSYSILSREPYIEIHNRIFLCFLNTCYSGGR